MTDSYKHKQLEELKRLEKMMFHEAYALSRGYDHIAGIDEVGRGPLAGPVVSAAVILNVDYVPIGVNDSKKLSEKNREALFDVIMENCISYGVGIVSEKIIDKINILNAVKLSMKIAVEAMKTPPDFLLVDAITLDNIDIPQKSIIKGDSLSVSIAAASIIAKVCRDRIMTAFDRYYPDYGFAKHKGYGTKSHFDAIKKNGLSPIHRVTFVHIC